MDNEMSSKRASKGTTRDHLRGVALKGTWNLVRDYLQPLAKRRGSLLLAACLVSAAALTACGKDDNDSSPSGVRAFIDDQVDGGIGAMKVPPTDSA